MGVWKLLNSSGREGVVDTAPVLGGGSRGKLAPGTPLPFQKSGITSPQAFPCIFEGVSLVFFPELDAPKIPGISRGVINGIYDSL